MEQNGSFSHYIQCQNLIRVGARREKSSAEWVKEQASLLYILLCKKGTQIANAPFVKTNVHE